jgi:diguanylate cyclase (GGDEF)-like protein
MTAPAAPEPRLAAESDLQQVGERRVRQLVALMALLAAATTTSVLTGDPSAARPGLVWLVLLPCFALAEVAVIHLPSIRSSHSHTLREIPAIAGLTFLPAQQYLTVYVLGAVLALVVWTHMRGVKLLFNLSLFTLEASLGALVYHLVLQGGDPLSVHGWAAAGTAVLVTDLLSAAAVTSAISLSEGTFDGSMWREALRSGAVAAVINTCAALLLVTLIRTSPTALPLLGVMIGLLVVAYRVYVRMARSAARNELLYRFVGSTGRTAAADDVIRVVLEEAASLFKSGGATLAIEDTDRPTVVLHHWEADGTRRAVVERQVVDQAWWGSALSGRPVRREGIAVPLTLADGRSACLLVVDKLFEHETFNDEELALLQTLAAHAAVALDKAHMLQRVTALAAEREHEALHDSLTGLPNRRAFNERLLAELQSGEASDDDDASPRRKPVGAGSGVVLLLDIDDFKDVNDTLGHTAGDRLLQVTGERLATTGGFVARLGGDEFAVLLQGSDAEHGVVRARELHDRLSAPIPLGAVRIMSTTSVGVAVYSAQSRVDEVLAQADMAMYAAKAERSGVAVFRAEDGNATSRRLALAADLPAAIVRGELSLSFQPLADPATDEVAGFEALLRWHHPRFGAVPPPEIIAVAQRTGLLRRLTDHVVGRALKARGAWQRAGHDITVAVNVTAADVCDQDLTDQVARLLRESGTPPDRLTLEVTESDAMHEPELALSVLKALADRGVRLAVDDFGTGYSSLAYLDRLPVHEVKIDQSFVSRLEQQAADATIVRATVGLAHELGLRLVAEGVESELARSLVEELGCDLYQGYGLSRPLPEGEVLDWLARHRSRPRRPTSRPALAAVPPAASA